MLSSATLVELLCNMDESPWADMRGKPLDSRGLSRLLNKYGIKPHVVRIGDSTPRGYTREDFHDSWSRYLPPSPAGAATSATAQQRTGCAVCHEPMSVVEAGQTTHPGCDWTAA